MLTKSIPNDQSNPIIIEDSSDNEIQLSRKRKLDSEYVMFKYDLENICTPDVIEILSTFVALTPAQKSNLNATQLVRFFETQSLISEKDISPFTKKVLKSVECKELKALCDLCRDYKVFIRIFYF